MFGGIVLTRNAIEELNNWKQDSDRKPLILKGARQVGKTWLMKQFGKEYYEDYFYFNFDEEDDIASIFTSNKDPFRIIELLGMIKGTRIEPEKHLIIFDEIQECPEALNSLKYFYEKANQYHVMSAGSLLGTLLAQPKTYPVGKVNILNIYPMTFDEFLCATDERLYQYYLTITKDCQIEDIFHKKLLEVYKHYLIIGGMPECVASWLKHKDCSKIQKIQHELIELYENDFSKHNGKVNSGRILLVFRSIANQLAKDNEKFVYGCVREGARAREFEEAIEWLVSAGMVIRIHNVSKPEHPLNAFEEMNHFKLFLFDVGLLKHMAGISNEAILLKADYQFKGALTENFCLQQMRELFDTTPKYYVQGQNNEIDFLLQKGMDVIPVEVKAGEAIHSKSLKKYITEKNPNQAIRYSGLGYKKQDVITNIPLYLINKTNMLLD